MIVVKSRRETNISTEAMFALVKDSYRVWSDMNLDTPWMHRSFEAFAKVVSGAAIFVAIDTETSELLGMHCFVSDPKKKCAYGFYLAVSPKCSRKGIASQLLSYESNIIRHDGFTHLEGNTAVDAPWSVQWHLKNGYRLIGYKRSPLDNHYTYVFRKQLRPVKLNTWAGIFDAIRHPFYSLNSNSFFCKIRFCISYVITHLTKNRQGQLRPFLKCLYRLHDKG